MEDSNEFLLKTFTRDQLFALLLQVYLCIKRGNEDGHSDEDMLCNIEGAFIDEGFTLTGLG